jgi:hypothetical protein
MWLVVVVPTDQGSNPGIAPKKSPSLCSLACGCGAFPAQATVRCAGLGNGIRQPKFSLAHMGMGQGSGVFLARVIRSLLNCNAVGAVLPPPVEFF